MIGIANDDLELMLGSVAPAIALGQVPDNSSAGVVIDIWARLFVAASPAAQPDDFVVLGPAPKGIVGSMISKFLESITGSMDSITDAGILGILKPVVQALKDKLSPFQS